VWFSNVASGNLWNYLMLKLTVQLPELKTIIYKLNKYEQLHHRPVSKWRVHGAGPRLPHMSLWGGVVFILYYLVKHRWNFTFLLRFYLNRNVFPFLPKSELMLAIRGCVRTTLGHTQPPIEWLPGDLSLRVKRPGREADHSPPPSAKIKEWVEVYLHFPNTPSWRDA
jgi:hypothetical protein